MEFGTAILYICKLYRLHYMHKFVIYFKMEILFEDRNCMSHVDWGPWKTAISGLKIHSQR
jgi:hypothetical protein